MYVCKPGLFMRAVSWLVMLALLPEVYFCLYMLKDCAPEERTYFLGGALIFGVLFLTLFWRMIVFAPAWLEYDDDKLLFHFSRQVEQTVLWQQLNSEYIQAAESGRNLLFRFALPDDRNRQLLVTPMFSGYLDFKHECERRGIIRRPLTAKQAYEQMEPYLEGLFKEVENKINEDKK